MRLKDKLSAESTRRHVIVEGQVVTDLTRCVQCGICSYYCPIGINVRRHAWIGETIIDSHCLTCGECVVRCPRGVLRFEKTTIFSGSNSVGKKTVIAAGKLMGENG